MHTFADYLMSVFLAGMILFIIFALKFQGEATTIDTTQYRAARIGTMSIAKAIERDFNNIGAQFLPNSHQDFDPSMALTGFDTTGIPAYFSFMAQTDSTQPAVEVRYEWRESANTVKVNGSDKPLIDVRRLVAGAVDGSSSHMITNLEIHPLTCDSTINWVNLNGPSSKVRQILVRLTAVSPLGPGDTLEEVRWETMFRPVNMWRQWSQTAGC